MENNQPVKGRDYLLVGCFTMVLYAIVLACGGPLTMHEGVLSQTTKAMLADHDWLVPHYGEAPWLERPPLPQWISCAICTVIGQCEAEWNVRLGPALAGLTTVLLTLWLGGRLLGRLIAILGALMLATMYNFIRYSTLAEADIFLSPIVAGALCAFAYTEILRTPSENDSVNPMGKRPWSVLVFFVLLGMTNLAKGLVFGTVIAVAPIVLYQLWTKGTRTMLTFLTLLAWAHVTKLLDISKMLDLEPKVGMAICMGPMAVFVLWHIGCFSRYIWLWGWLAFAAVALPWPVMAYLQYPDALELWKFDLLGRLNQNYLGEPVWYYFECLTWVTQPWAIAAGSGLALTYKRAFKDGSPAERFVWCWAWMPILVFSLSHGKHHHYMLHYLAPWAILSAQGLAALARNLNERGILRQSVPAFVGLFALVFVAYCVGFAYKGAYLNRSIDDTAFLHEVRRTVPMDQPLMIESAEEALEGLRMQFYVGDSVYFLHNLSFVRDDRIKASEVYVVTRYNRKPMLDKYGDVEPILKCKHSRREKDESERWTLFRLHLRDDLERKNVHVRISPMQAMYRTPGPDLDAR